MSLVTPVLDSASHAAAGTVALPVVAGLLLVLVIVLALSFADSASHVLDQSVRARMDARGHVARRRARPIHSPSFHLEASRQ